MFTHTLSGQWPVYPYKDNDIQVQLNLSRLNTIPFIIDIFITIIFSIHISRMSKYQISSQSTQIRAFSVPFIAMFVIYLNITS